VSSATLHQKASYLTPSEATAATVSKTKKHVSQAYGGLQPFNRYDHLCRVHLTHNYDNNVVRAFLIEEAKVVKRVINVH
jgi:hypothetical protein